MIYFDNAATGGRKPDEVLRAVSATLNGYCANPGRSGHSLSVAALQSVYRCRKLLARFFNAPDPERIILTKNCTEALNIAIFGTVGFCREQNPSQKPHIISTVAEHNSVLRPLLCLHRNDRISLTLLPLEHGRIVPRQFADAVRPNTVAAVYTLASNVTGMSIRPQEIRSALPPQILTVCDGAQACGHIPIDLQQDGIDALCLAGHKGMHGIQGSGALLLSERIRPTPFLFGGTGSESFNPDMPDFYPDRLEAGTLSCPAAASLTAGILHLIPRLQKNGELLNSLTKKLCDGLRIIPEIRLFSQPNPFGIVSFDCKTMQSELFAQILSDEHQIAVRGGFHCAPLMHKALHTQECGLVRVSFSEFNTEKEIDDFLIAVRSILKKYR